MGVEFELKFRATDAKHLALRAAYPGEAETVEMETTYYDTPDGELSKRWFTLRRRLENGKAVCTLKTPAEGNGRGEFEVFDKSIENAIPELCKLSGVTDLTTVTEKGLVAVCGAKFQRIAKTLVLPDCTVELALDKGILTGGGKSIPLCEVEVELKTGSREGTMAFAAKLSRDFGLEAEKHSKFCRALALARGE